MVKLYKMIKIKKTIVPRDIILVKERKMKVMLANRRRHHRYPVTVQLSVRFGTNFLEGTECSDISFGGMCVVLNERINIKSSEGVVMLAQQCGEEIIFFESDFVRLWDNRVFFNRNDTRMGIRFKNVDMKNFDNLCKIISYQDELHKVEQKA